MKNPTPQETLDTAAEIRVWERIAKGYAAIALGGLLIVGFALNAPGHSQPDHDPITDLPTYQIILILFAAFSGGATWTFGQTLESYRENLLTPPQKNPEGARKMQKRIDIVINLRGLVLILPPLTMTILDFFVPTFLQDYEALKIPNYVLLIGLFTPGAIFLLATLPLTRSYAAKIKEYKEPANTPYPKPKTLGNYLAAACLNEVEMALALIRWLPLIVGFGLVAYLLRLLIRAPYPIINFVLWGAIFSVPPLILFFATRPLARKLSQKIKELESPLPVEELAEEVCTLPNSKRVSVQYSKRKDSPEIRRKIRRTLQTIQPKRDTESAIQALLNQEFEAMEITIVKVKVLKGTPSGLYIGEKDE